jgi:hypothetical protein
MEVAPLVDEVQGQAAVVEQESMDWEEDVEKKNSLSKDAEKKMTYEEAKMKLEEDSMKAVQQSICPGCVRPRVCSCMCP